MHVRAWMTRVVRGRDAATENPVVDAFARPIDALRASGAARKVDQPETARRRTRAVDLSAFSGEPHGYEKWLCGSGHDRIPTSA